MKVDGHHVVLSKNGRRRMAIRVLEIIVISSEVKGNLGGDMSKVQKKVAIDVFTL